MSQLTKAEIIDYCAQQVDQPKTLIGDVLEAHIACMRMALFGGKRVRLGDIGTVERVATPARKGRNPLTGAAIDVDAAHRLKVRASRKMRG